MPARHKPKYSGAATVVDRDRRAEVRIDLDGRKVSRPIDARSFDGPGKVNDERTEWWGTVTSAGFDGIGWSEALLELADGRSANVIVEGRRLVGNDNPPFDL